MAKKSVQFSVANPHAAGIDVGSKSHYASIGSNNEDVREFPVFTSSLHQMASWFKANKIQTIAMESTGFYWKSLFLLLQDYGFEVILVNAAHIKNVRGKKSDVLDCQWIWQLHSAGLLHASFQPDSFTEELRTYTRHRKSLIEGASRYVSKMQKAMIIMNIHLPVVLSDIVGQSGQTIIKAILSGVRDANELANLASSRVKASKEEIAEALTGNWQQQYLFELQQCWEMYQFHHIQISQCDQQIETILKKKVIEQSCEDLYYEPAKKKKRSKNDPQFNMAKYVYQLTEGIDLTQIEGVSYGLLLTLISETGLDLSKFPTAKHFASWLGLSPNKKISGGKVISSSTKKNSSRLALAFRQAANSVGNQKGGALSHFFRKMAFRKGRKAAITATAHKLAVIVYKMLEEKVAYKPMSDESYQEIIRSQKIKRIQKTIKKLNLTKEDLAFA